MQYVSRILQPVIATSKNAAVKNIKIINKSQKLFQECGLAHPTSCGRFTLLPLAQRSLQKLENFIRSSLENIGAQPISLHGLNPEGIFQKKVVRMPLKMADVWADQIKQTPSSNEEALANLLASIGPLKQKQFPFTVYQVTQNYATKETEKGLLREREPLMLDAYSIHSNQNCAKDTYTKITQTFHEIFKTLKLPVYKIDIGQKMGSSLAHEWQVPSEVGDTQIAVCQSCSHAKFISEDKTRQCEKCGSNTDQINSLEVGHTAILDTKFSESFNAHFASENGPNEPVIISSYSLGLTRILIASVEGLSTEQSLRWPKLIAPYSAIIIGPKKHSKEWKANIMKKVEQLAETIGKTQKGDILIDDRHNLTIEERAAMAEKLGYPMIIVCGQALMMPSRPGYEVTHCMPHGKILDHIIMEDIAEVEINGLIRIEA